MFNANLQLFKMWICELEYAELAALPKNTSIEPYVWQNNEKDLLRFQYKFRW